MNQILMEPYAHRRKQAYALALATLIYLLFTVAVVIDLRYYQTEQRTAEPQKENKAPHPIHSQQDKGPAPVRFMNIPKQSAPTTPASPQQQPPQKQTESAPLQDPATEAYQPQPAQKKSLESPELKRSAPKVEQRKVEERAQPLEKPQARSEPKKRSKNKWFKPRVVTQSSNPASAEKQTSMPRKDSERGVTRQQFASNLSQGFNNFVTQRKKTSFQYSLNRVKGNHAESLEYEMFAGRMVHNICTATNYSPLDLRKALIKEHDIVVQVTCNQNRTIGDITLLQPSYDDQINDYLIAIMKTVSPPKFPSSHTTNTLTFPMKIHISRQYYGRGLRMVPA